MLTDPTAVLLELAGALDAASVRYAIGGSLASSRHGEYRSTNDVDVLVDLPLASLDALAAALEPEFHLRTESARASVRAGHSFAAVHLGQMVKIDFFVASDDKLDELQLERREAVELQPNAPPVYFSSAEDMVLRKLDWYQRSDGVRELQMRDAVGILKTRGADLDLAVLSRTATIVGLRAVLDEALEQAGLIET